MTSTAAAKRILSILVTTLLYFVFYKLSLRPYVASKYKNTMLVVIGFIFALALTGLLHTVNIVYEPFDNLFTVTASKLCKGGPYMWQGNSDVANMCRQLYSTPEGMKDISEQDCGKKKFSYCRPVNCGI